MPLTTQCGRCGRRFPVYAQELRSRHDRIECPQCGLRFDALATLLDEPMEGPQTSRARNGAPSDGWHPGNPPTASGPRIAGQAGRGAGVAWGLAALVLGLGLAAQVLWWKRGELLRDPGARQALDGLCHRVGCQVPRPRIPGTLTLLDPTLTTGPEEETLSLRLTMRNEADLAQSAPVLELELLDLQGDLAAVRRFSPAEYAPEGLDTLAPGETLEVLLPLVKPGPEPAGFKVRLL